MYREFIKRLIDILLSFIAILVLSPVLLIIGIAVKIKLGSPILFRQKRPGKNEKIFTLYKFRTMNNRTDKNGNFLPDELRMTKFGKILRSTSLDELPELLNILKGDMSIVGPRPLLVQYLPLYNEVQKRRHEVRPGLTGLAQINGRNTLSWEDKFSYDVQYVDGINFINDTIIILKTINKVFIREGINSYNAATIETFQGGGKNKIRNKLLIIGAGGHGKVVAEIALKMGKWNKIDFLDDNPDIESFFGTNIIGKSSDYIFYINDYDIFIAIGDNKIREKIQIRLEQEEVNIPTLVHPSAIIGEQVIIGKGTVIMANATINCCSNIGEGVIINTGTTVDHDNIIANYVHLSPGVHTAGNVKISNGTWVGIGATISNNVYIAEECVIGAGGVVINNLNKSGCYVGVPVRRLNQDVRNSDISK